IKERITLNTFLYSQPLPSCLPPAAILDDQSTCGRGERLALALARENINSLMEGPSEARVEVDVYELSKDSQYDTTETMCQILPKGVVSVIGPASSPASGSTISHICGEKEIPHVKIGPEETPKLPYLRFASVTLYPSNEDLSLAIGSILRSFGYPTASLVFLPSVLCFLPPLVFRLLSSLSSASFLLLSFLSFPLRPLCPSSSRLSSPFLSLLCFIPTLAFFSSTSPSSISLLFFRPTGPRPGSQFKHRSSLPLGL
uniref:Receptor ligand binding region domain-containing protein n=1 Tax=Labrus bergylta TaxID=56723 RepID=A0A3Q3FAH9_9LABR